MESTGPESPVIVRASPMSSPMASPVSSPVFVNSHSNNYNENNDTRNDESKNSKNIELLELLETKISQVNGLQLPILDESLIKVQVENRPSEDTKTDTSTSSSAPTSDNGASVHIKEVVVADKKSTEKITETKASEFVKDFKYCQEEFQKQIKANNCVISPETVMKLIRIAMTIVEQTKETGANKKIFVVKLLNDLFINDTTGILGEHKIEALTLISGNIVSDVIDFVVDASKGKLNVNKIEAVVETVAKTCSLQCWSRIFKRA